MKKSGEKTETFSASALAVGTPKACYPSSTQPGPEGVPSQIRAVDRPDSWSLGRLHPPLDGSPTQYICLSFWIFEITEIGGRDPPHHDGPVPRHYDG